MNKKRRLAVWGTGMLAEKLLELNPNIRPDFFIDNDTSKTSFRKKPVKTLEKVEIAGTYIVIMVKRYLDIVLQLKDFGLREGEDFKVFHEVVECGITRDVDWFADKLDEIGDKFKYQKKTVLFDCNLGIRGSLKRFEFFRRYIAERDKDSFLVLLQEAQYISERRAEELFGCTVLPTPAIESFHEMSVSLGVEELSEREIDFIKRLRETKAPINNVRVSLDHIAALYQYYKKIMRVVKPSKVVTTVAWGVETYILKHLAEEGNIPYGVFEWGWIPGTLQIDPCGIIGQGECAQHPEIINKIPYTEADLKKVHEIKEYVISSKIDSRSFEKPKVDILQLNRLDRNKKTIFLIGMNEKWNAVNSDSEYYMRVVSKTHFSMEDLLNHCVLLCREHGWQLIFKQHPDDMSIDMNQEQYHDVVYIIDTQLDELIDLSDVIVSISSSAEYRALIYEKPVIQAGITALSGMGCTYEVKKKEELGEKLCVALEKGMTTEQKENFDIHLARLLKRYLWDDLSDRPIRYGLSLQHELLDYNEDGSARLMSQKR